MRHGSTLSYVFGASIGRASFRHAEQWQSGCSTSLPACNSCGTVPPINNHDQGVFAASASSSSPTKRPIVSNDLSSAFPPGSAAADMAALQAASGSRNKSSKKSVKKKVKKR